MPKNPERADQLEDIADERDLTLEEKAELRGLWSEAAADPEREEWLAELQRRIEKYEGTHR